MTDDVIKTERALYIECHNAAVDILEEWKRENPDDEPDADDSEWSDRAHEWADSSQHVIYNYRAIQICANCDTTRGEEFVEDVGLPETPTFESIAVMIAFGEIRARIEDELREIIESGEDPEYISDAPAPMKMKVHTFVGAHAYACVELSNGAKVDIRLDAGKSDVRSLREYADDKRRESARALEMAEIAERAATILESGE